MSSCLCDSRGTETRKVIVKENASRCVLVCYANGVFNAKDAKGVCRGVQAEGNGRYAEFCGRRV